MRPDRLRKQHTAAANRGHAAKWSYDRELRFLQPRRGRRPERELVWLGVGVPDGALVHLLNMPSRGRQFVAVYQRDGWPGLQVSVAQDDRLPDALKVRAMLEAAQFARAGWTLAWCEHARRHPQRVRQGATRWRALPPLFHGSHWYVRPIRRGRQPLACFLAREAAKKARARAAPSARRQSARR